MIQLVCMFYNCEEAIIPTLESWKSQVNFFNLFLCQPEGKEYDKTEELVKEWITTNKNSYFEKIKFQGFSKSRNYCLDKCSKKYKWIVFIDDTYHFKGDSLAKELKDLDFNCMSIRITSEKGGNTYDSKRISKTAGKIRYIGDIHENLDCDTEYIIKTCKITDKFYESHEKRSFDRIPYDLNLLEGKTDHRSLYYVAIYKYILYCQRKITPFVVIDSLLKRLKIKEDIEEIFSCLLYLALIKYDLYLEDKSTLDKLGESQNRLREIVGIYLSAALSFEFRCGECYYHIYKITGKKHYIEKAYENRKLPPTGPGECRMPIDESIYNSLIPEEYEMSKKELLINI